MVAPVTLLLGVLGGLWGVGAQPRRQPPPYDADDDPWNQPQETTPPENTGGTAWTQLPNQPFLSMPPAATGGTGYWAGNTYVYDDLPQAYEPPVILNPQAPPPVNNPEILHQALEELRRNTELHEEQGRVIRAQQAALLWQATRIGDPGQPTSHLASYHPGGVLPPGQHPHPGRAPLQGQPQPPGLPASAERAEGPGEHQRHVRQESDTTPVRQRTPGSASRASGGGGHLREHTTRDKSVIRDNLNIRKYPPNKETHMAADYTHVWLHLNTQEPREAQTGSLGEDSRGTAGDHPHGK